MKCPTCGYIGFETTDRCRNCGYEFRLSTPVPAAPDLTLTEENSGGPLQELTLRPADPRQRAASAPPARAVAGSPDLDRVLQNLDQVIGAPAPPEPDLPLFDQDRGADLAPLVTSAEPRRPLAVRRATPDPARLRPKPVRHQPEPVAGHSMALPLPDTARPRAAQTTPTAVPSREPKLGAPPLPRALAALIDLAIIAGIDAIVISFTLRLCGLTTTDVGVLPPGPTLVFFLLVNGGYLAAFTAAGGQTIGKMALGLKVVGHADLPVSARLCVLRTLGCLISIGSLGLGFLPALLADGGRALEDRLADTRVVRVSA
jgi:uncharacterized RDD family membrane protein YckC